MKLKILSILIYLFFLSCSNHKPTKLVIILVADQMRPDHFSRFDSLYKGGFRWLADNAVSFENAFHQHGYTATGPGHFSIGSGLYPGPAGVLGNRYFDRELNKVVNCVEDPDALPIGGRGIGRSIKRYSNNMIGDIIKMINEDSKVYSVAGKDRAAIMLAGQNPDLVLYYNKLDRFISSSFYVDSIPNWVMSFNEELNLDSYKDSTWNKILSDSLYNIFARSDYFDGEVDLYRKKNDKDIDDYSPVFPIGFNKGAKPGKEFLDTPWFDEKLFSLSSLIVEEAELGKDDNVDLLCIGISAMDYIIHSYGPFSQEAMDYFLRLDKQLNDFINNLDAEIGLENIEFVLTSDHGGLPLPEYLPNIGLVGGRINKQNLQEAFEWIDDEISEKYDDGLYVRDWTNYYFNHEKIKEKNIEIDGPINIIKKYLSMVQGIKSVLSKTEIMNSENNDPVSIRLRNMIHEQKSADVFVLVEEGYVYRSYGTSHGSPYDYDAHVPLLFSREGRMRKVISDSVETVDIVPTILDILNIKTKVNFDGRVLPLK